GSLLLGPAPTEEDVSEALAGHGLRVTRVPDIEERIAALLADGHVVAHVDGPMEFGPRALGNRSVLCGATDVRINDWLNRRFRRSEFMPFAPATLDEHADALYQGITGGRLAAAYMTMTFTCTARMREEAPAAVHVDSTARPQLVSALSYPR